mmetsp:Transcript_89268/g.257458  ORF Transcript_89268/g.257458 Transcript_89268/m.257458 type:complete len:359 (-) Transcript_89268:168-1244(-)
MGFADFCYNIPICGGFCAPTKSTEESWLRHFSNEYTVPLAAKYMKLAPCIEFNPCCLLCARIGSRRASRQRTPIMMFAFVLNIVALVFSVIAAMGLSTNPKWLERFAWVKGHGTMEGCGDRCNVEVYVGPMMRLDKLSCLGPDGQVYPACVARAASMDFDTNSTGVQEDQLRRTVVWNDHHTCRRLDDKQLRDQCIQCKESLVPKSAIIMSIVTQLPTLTTDLQRATRFGDVNCQKTMGVVSNVVSLFNSLVALWSFRTACYSAMPKTVGNGHGHIEWSIGIGFRCLLVATLIKIPDAICHLLVPVPQGKWSPPKKELTLDEYMRTGDEGESDSCEDDSGSEEESSSTDREPVLASKS